MKELILTSSLGIFKRNNEKKIVCKMEKNLIDILKKILYTKKNLLLICSDPDNYSKNDEIVSMTKESFKMSGLDFKETVLIDNRNKDSLTKLLKASEMVVLCGGHLPTQNDWFKEINLKKYLKSYRGVVIGESAGSMNCASNLYCCPELAGEALDPKFSTWISGLGLTEIVIFPHFSYFQNIELDRLKMIEDIILKFSFKKSIYAINDGSFIVIDDKNIIIHGECFKISNGKITKICKNNKTSRLDV